MINETKQPSRTLEVKSKVIKCYDELGNNIDEVTVKSFGEEWKAFHQFKDEEIKRMGDSYFDLVEPAMTGKEKIAADFGCGTGRWTKYFAERVGAVAAIDPSDAIITAASVLENTNNVHLYKASIDNLPFADNYFDFAFSLGVLHHIPDTQKAMNACVEKVKKNGYFLVYLYYNLDNRSALFKFIFWCSNLIRLVVSKLPSGLKKFTCDFLAVVLYMPFILFSRLLKLLGVSKKARGKIPLNIYESSSFYIIRNDSLDRFGTPLEHRFSRAQIEVMMKNAGLENIQVSANAPYWHAIGKKR
jgi:ubiquinone/menaquinone biosynthesis C-methylase UbiE